MKLISIVTPCYNEEENVEEIYKEIKKIFSHLPKYKYEHIFIDNASSDSTVSILKKIAQKDRHLKIIVNARNFGWIRSPFYAMLQAKGDAVVLLVADLQDPPPLIKNFIAKWEEGYKVVIGVKTGSEENWFMRTLRGSFYKFVSKISEIELVNNFMGFGLYDRKVIEVLRQMDDSYPYFRGLVAEIGFEMAKIEYKQSARKRGLPSSNFYRLLDVAILGITSYSRAPLRLMTVMGMILSVISLLIAVVYIFLKIFLWSNYSLGIATLVIGFFFFSSVQLFFIGIIGEYIGIIHTRLLKRPLVIEKERINFD